MIFFDQALESMTYNQIVDIVAIIYCSVVLYFNAHYSKF